ncbi:MAG: ATP-binding protein [Anaerolineae bacterium]
MVKPRKRLGVITDGAFNAGLTVRLDPGVSTEALHIGDFVIVEGQEYLYFSSITDMQLRATDARVQADPPPGEGGFIQEVLRGTATYATVQVKPYLMMPRVDEGGPVAGALATEEGPRPVKTIPMHFAALCEAQAQDFANVFGKEDKTHFAMGMPLTQEIDICLNLERFVERSNGIFGQSGTGKSFLARILLCGVIERDVASNLIFDMHNEYAFGVEREGGGWAKGLRELFGPQIVVYSLDERSAQQRGRVVDGVIRIGLNQIQADDVLLLADELDLNPTARATVGLLRDHYGERWLQGLLDMDAAGVEQFCRDTNAHPGATAALQRKLKELQRRGYIVSEAAFSQFDEIIALLDRGKHVILQFGQYDRVLDYMLVANIVTRRICERYDEKWTQYLQTKSPADRPRHLMITIEEAHKFLNPEAARQTIFGTIAREMRKFNVTLMVIDQRPSGIDTEVLSQIGTRVTGKLTDERDIEAVLTGVGNRAFLKGALESLDTRQQVLLMGHALPMPIVVRTRSYDEAFYRIVSEGEKRPGRPEDLGGKLDELFG